MKQRSIILPFLLLLYFFYNTKPFNRVCGLFRSKYLEKTPHTHQGSGLFSGLRTFEEMFDTYTVDVLFGVFEYFL